MLWGLISCYHIVCDLFPWFLNCINCLFNNFCPYPVSLWYPTWDTIFLETSTNKLHVELAIFHTSPIFSISLHSHPKINLFYQLISSCCSLNKGYMNILIVLEMQYLQTYMTQSKVHFWKHFFRKILTFSTKSEYCI